jgi:Rrf2 family protein
MISKTGIHAVRALIALAELAPDTFRGAGAIAEAVGAPRNYLGKLLQQLAQSGLLVSQKGAGGGFALVRKPDAITVFDVLEQVEDVSAWENCFLGKAECSDENPCHVHDRWKPVRGAYLDFLRGFTLGDLARAGGLSRLEALLGDSVHPAITPTDSTQSPRSLAMHPTQALMDEHQTILRVLCCVEELIRNDVHEDEPRETFAAIVDFIRTYADKLHHAKEEDLLFPAMEARGIPAEQGPTAVMRQEHEIGRTFVARMASACGDEDSFSRAALAEPALGYVDLLRGHIAKEDHILYPMADRLFDAATIQKLGTSYVEAETERFDADIHPRYENWAKDLAVRLGVDQARYEVSPSCG